MTSLILAAALARAQPYDPQLASIIPQNIQYDYTCVLSDAGKHLLHPAGDVARQWVINTNAAIPFPIGTVLTFVNPYTSAIVTINSNGDTVRLAGSGAAGPRYLAGCSIATAIKIGATEWIISGTGLT